MSPSAYQVIPVTCPKCQARFAAPVLMTLDVAENPEAKALLLSGQLNVAVCTNCGYAGILSTPLVYHDGSKELLFTYVPPGSGAADLERQRVVGELTNRLISSLPPEKRKGYLLNPRSFLRMESLVEAVLEADGISPEMLQEQRNRAALLDRLIRTPTEEIRRAVARENDAQIDYEFFHLLSLNAETAEATGQSDIAQRLVALREELLEWTTRGREIAARGQAIESLGSEITREGLLEKLVGAALADQWMQVETMVAVARPVIDYAFYQQLAARIETAEQAQKSAEVKALRALRSQVLELTSRIDAELQEATREAAEFLSAVLRSDDPERELRGSPDRVDELFLGLLQARMEEAAQAGRTDLLGRLQQIGAIIARLVLESQPADIQFINHLLSADYPDGTQAILQARREQVDHELLELMLLVADDLRQNGREQVAQRLALVREQATALLG